MNARENARIARALYHRFNLRDFESVILLISPTAEWECVARKRNYLGLKGYREMAESWITAFSDIDFDIVNLIATDQWVAAEYWGSGTHDGWWREQGRMIPPSGNRIRIAFCEVIRINGRKILSSRKYYDKAELLGQMGRIDKTEEQP